MVCKLNQKHLCIPCLVGRCCSTRKAQCIPEVSGCSLESPRHRKALSWDTLGFAALSASRQDGKTWSPGVETEAPPRDKPGKNNKETAAGKDGNIRAMHFCVTQAAWPALRETRASLYTPKAAGQRMQKWAKERTELAELLLDYARWCNPWVIQPADFFTQPKTLHIIMGCNYWALTKS